MRLSTPHAMVGLVSLGLLSLVHWYRKQHYGTPEFVQYIVGIAPNFLAAIAMPFVLLSMWTERDPVPIESTRRSRFLILPGITGIGLVAWLIFAFLNAKIELQDN